MLFQKRSRNLAPGGVPRLLDLFPTPDPHYVKKYYFPVRELERELAFDMKGEDVIVFLHIQKTGGTTFGRHLVQNVRLEVPCDCRPGQKKCTCYRPNRRETWLFSRFSTGWSCGLHADWTELTNCVPGVLDRRESATAKTPRYRPTALSRFPAAPRAALPSDRRRSPDSVQCRVPFPVRCSMLLTCCAPTCPEPFLSRFTCPPLPSSRLCPAPSFCIPRQIDCSFPPICLVHCTLSVRGLLL
uniref:Heparan-sulfate 6-O-sulfotransferase n=1 Tax=Accipiter nisus TaxID=211598 RepID=A0A8B9MQY7_9AVES